MRFTTQTFFILMLSTCPQFNLQAMNQNMSYLYKTPNNRNKQDHCWLFIFCCSGLYAQSQARQTDIKHVEDNLAKHKTA